MNIEEIKVSTERPEDLHHTGTCWENSSRRPSKKCLDTNREVGKEYCYRRRERNEFQDTTINSKYFQEDMYSNGK